MSMSNNKSTATAAAFEVVPSVEGCATEVPSVEGCVEAPEEGDKDQEGHVCKGPHGPPRDHAHGPHGHRHGPHGRFGGRPLHRPPADHPHKRDGAADRPHGPMDRPHGPMDRPHGPMDRPKDRPHGPMDRPHGPMDRPKDRPHGPFGGRKPSMDFFGGVFRFDFVAREHARGSPLQGDRDHHARMHGERRHGPHAHAQGLAVF